jgi:hypothetical protein
MTDIIIADNTDNTSLKIYDSTDYASLNSSINAVNAVRFLFSTYNTVLNAGEVGSLRESYEYIVKSGSFVMDNITYSEGNTFVARQNFTLPTTGVSVWTTGYYSTYNEYTPDSVDYFEFLPSDLGESGTIIADNARTVRYEVYNLVRREGETLNDEVYIVVGSADSYITMSIEGQVYYAGQVFLSQGSDDFVSTNGAYVVQFLASGSFDFWTNGNSSVIYQNYINSLSDGTLNASQDFKDNFISTHTNFSLPYIQSATASSYDFSSVQASLDVIVNYLGTKNKFIK